MADSEWFCLKNNYTSLLDIRLFFDTKILKQSVRLLSIWILFWSFQPLMMTYFCYQQSIESWKKHLKMLPTLALHVQRLQQRFLTSSCPCAKEQSLRPSLRKEILSTDICMTELYTRIALCVYFTHSLRFTLHSKRFI